MNVLNDNMMNVKTRVCKRKTGVSGINKLESDLKNFSNWQYWLMASIKRAIDHKIKYYIK